MNAPHEKPRSDDHVLQTPIWVTAVRGVQALLALIILCLCAALMHDAYLEEEGFCLAMSLFTWIAIAYVLVTEKVPSLQKAYHIIAVLAIDGLFMILWLAAWAATAARRAKYIYNVNVNNCSDDGSLLNSKTCQIAKRGVILFKSGMAMLAAVAGLGALVWLLFIATFVWTLMAYLRGRKEGRFAMSTGTSTPSNKYQMENKMAESQPMNSQPYQSQTQAPFQQDPSYPPQGQYQQQAPQPTYQQNLYSSQGYGQEQQQPPIQPQMTGSTAAPAYEQNPYYQPPPQAVSPPPQQYQTPPPQQYQTPPPQQYQQPYGGQ